MFVQPVLPEIPLFFKDIRIPAGFPSPANDYLEEAINLTEEFVKHPLSTFLVTTEGDSMINAFIPNRSMLLVDKSLKPVNGDIVVAVLNGDFTVKFFQQWNGGCRLLPANNKYKAVEITEEMGLTVWGVVTRIFIDPKDIKHVCPC